MQAHKTKESVYILIPVHNRRETTLTCLEYLHKTGVLQQYYVVVIDDGSTDGTTDIVLQQYPDTLIVSGNGDLWWTGAIALGMEYAAELNAEYFIWLNDDCLPTKDALFQMVSYMRNHPRTIVAPTCYLETPGGSLVKQDNAFIRQTSFAADPGEILEAEGLSGWCVGIPSVVLHEIGVPDAKRFPHYSGDDTYIYRATQTGFNACVLGDLKVHLLGTVHPKLDFRNHFCASSTPLSTFHSLFLSKRSPYLLKTKFFYFRERYGALLGLGLFAIKLIIWFWKWMQIQVQFWINPRSFLKDV